MTSNRAISHSSDTSTQRWTHRSWAGLALVLVGAAATFNGCSDDTGTGKPTTSGSGTSGSTGAGGDPTTTTSGAGGQGGSTSSGATSSGSAGSGGTATGAGGKGGAGGSGGSGGSGGGGAPDASTEGGSACSTALGTSVAFDGTKIDLLVGDLGADLPGGDVPRTVELWAKFLGISSWTAEKSVIETGLAKGGNNKVLGIDMSGYSGTMGEFGPYTNGFSDNNDPNGVYYTTPSTGWLHLSWSYSGNHGTLTFTVNGVEQAIKTQGGMPTLALTQGIVTLGASQTFPPGDRTGWTGQMDELRLWKVARTPAETLRDMKTILKGDEAGLVAYYHFDEGSGDFADDVSKKPSHRLNSCASAAAPCPAANTATVKWVASDAPGPFTCAK
ncbi:MAG TPA: LamG-like jellyroll fold domain-containing protein [Polyangiaceae bacterium]|nr:LamG-like jellyroll fold domain-containing protein [Polyangiaceae bacterium]